MSLAAKKKLELTAQLREITGRKVRHLRATGILPAVLYGKGQEAVSLQVPLKDFDRAYREAGESTLIYLNVGADAYPTIIKDVGRDAVSGGAIHADFYKVSLTEKIKAMVPVVFTGTSPAVADLQAIFVRNANELEVEALPQNLPHEVAVDISSLKNFGDQILLGSISVKDAVLVGGADEILATVQEPKSEEELLAELAEPTTDVTAVEEIKKEITVDAEETAEGEPALSPEAKPEATKE